MIMTDEEIFKEYKAAKKKSQQVNILADENCCDKDTIKEILERCGIPREELYPKRGRKKAEKPIKTVSDSNSEPKTENEDLTTEENEKKTVSDTDFAKNSENEPQNAESRIKTVRDEDSGKCAPVHIPALIRTILIREMISIQEGIDKEYSKMKEITDFLHGNG